jgi:hypothetical protein
MVCPPAVGVDTSRPPPIDRQNGTGRCIDPYGCLFVFKRPPVPCHPQTPKHIHLCLLEGSPFFLVLLFLRGRFPHFNRQRGDPKSGRSRTNVLPYTLPRVCFTVTPLLNQRLLAFPPESFSLRSLVHLDNCYHLDYPLATFSLLPPGISNKRLVR